jgi:hypothetical protein
VTEAASIKDLHRIPGVGPSIANDLYRLGAGKVNVLVGMDPQQLYDDLITLEGRHVDRWLLSVFRVAVYFAQTPTNSDPELLRWWNWKDPAPSLLPG